MTSGPGGMSTTVAGVPVPIRLVRQIRRAKPVEILLVFADHTEAAHYAGFAAREGARALGADAVQLQARDTWLCLRGAARCAVPRLETIAMMACRQTATSSRYARRATAKS